MSVKSRWIDLYRKPLNCDLDLSECKDIRFSASLSICKFSSATGLGSSPEFFYSLVLSIVIFVEISAIKMSSVTSGGSIGWNNVLLTTLSFVYSHLVYFPMNYKIDSTHTWAIFRKGVVSYGDNLCDILSHFAVGEWNRNLTQSSIILGRRKLTNVCRHRSIYSHEWFSHFKRDE